MAVSAYKSTAKFNPETTLQQRIIPHERYGDADNSS